MKKDKNKKDSEWAAKIEQAIEKKYGSKAVCHPKADWNDEKEKDYLEQIKELAEKERRHTEKTEKVKQDGFLVSKKLLKKGINRNCPVCNSYSFDIRDDLYTLKYECCRSCYVQYISDGREERWKSGWRPNNENHKSKT